MGNFAHGTSKEPKKGIPPALEGFVIDLAGKGHALRQIVEKLKEVHGVVVSTASVSRLVSRRRTERADIAKVVVREQISKELDSNLARLQQIRENIHKKVMDFEDKGEVYAYAKLMELEVKVIDRLLHYSGVDAPDDEKVMTGIRIFIPPEDPL